MMTHKSIFFLLLAGISLQLHAGTAWLIGAINLSKDKKIIFQSTATNWPNIFEGKAYYGEKIEIPSIKEPLLYKSGEGFKLPILEFSQTIIPWKSKNQLITIETWNHDGNYKWHTYTIQEKDDHKVHINADYSQYYDKIYSSDTEYILVLFDNERGIELIEKKDISKITNNCYCSVNNKVKQGSLYYGPCNIYNINEFTCITENN